MNHSLDVIEEVLVSQRSWGSGGSLDPEPSSQCVFFRVDDDLVEWDLGERSPDWRRLSPVREPRARALSRHIPALPFSVTTGGHLAVESGLEHDLVRELDRRPDVSWLVSQPLRVQFEDGLKHVPDLLEVHEVGVRLWDVRPRRRQNGPFHRVAARMTSMCLTLGWEYQVFSDASELRRRNLRWLACYRIESGSWPMQWVLRTLETDRASTVGELVDLAEGSRAALSALWHLVWQGEVVLDLDVVITDESEIRLRAES